MFWDITKINEPQLDPAWSDERKWAAYEEQKYNWMPLHKLELNSESRRLGPLKLSRGFRGLTYFFSTEVSHLFYLFYFFMFHETMVEYVF